ncbi:MAG: hypothetical protein HY721_01830 [Planctomycetes bacterium]|nr:hypothetical protein [Planctomycetota bacterium]
MSTPAIRLASGEAQLFVDDFLISEQSGLVRTLHPPRKDDGGERPVIALEDELGETKGTLEANGTILHDPRLDKWVMFALAFASGYPGASADRVRLYRFTSPDGMRWIKGDDGKPQRIAIDLYDPASKTSATNIDLFSSTYDENDPVHPYKGWLHFANWGETREGTYFMRSPDGIRWERGPQVLVAGSRTLVQDGRRMSGSGDVTTFYHDRQEGRFLANIRFAGVTNVENENRLRSRAFLFVDRLDQPIDLGRIERLGLIPPAAERNGDMPFDEYYSSTAWRYGSMWLGGLRIWHGAGDYPWSAAGAAYLKLVSSRDGLSWQKVPFRNEEGQPEVFVPNGKEGGNGARNDGGYMTELSNGPLRIGDELIYYYGASSWGKNHPRSYRVSGGGIFRARLRPDGFVSVDGGSLTTRPLVFHGDGLLINGVGPIEVEVLKATGESLGESLGGAQAKASVSGDSLRHRVRFGGRSLRDLAPEGIARLRFTVSPGGRLFSFTIAGAGTKTEGFDRDPGWIGVNHRSARNRPPATVRQDFGYSKTRNAGGKDAGEIGGLVSAAGEVAYYAKPIEPRTFKDRLSASGTLSCGDGGYHMLLGFFNADTAKEWRTPNTVAIRLNGRGDHFYAYVEYCTSKWRAGGDTTPFPSRQDPQSGRMQLIGFPSGHTPHGWSIAYDPTGNGGKGVIAATIDDATATCNLDEGHAADGATFNRFGVLGVMKSVDNGTDVWFDDIAIDGRTEACDRDPLWEGKSNRETWTSTLVRPWFDFGFSPTQLAGGKAPGELGGQIFRGDCRYPERMASYGDAIGPLELDKPFRASGKIALTRGVTDSTTLFGFYNSRDSMRSNESQSDGVPESVAGIHVEGPSSEGFLFYPVFRTKGGGSTVGRPRECSHIYPDGAAHDWSLEYDPAGAGGRGRITVSLDGKACSLDLEEGAKSRGTQLDRFGIVTTWIDGNSQDVYWDDIAYTVAQE